MQDKIKQWLIKGDALSPSDKAEIRAAVKEAGISHTFATKCNSCYTDAVTLLAIHYGVKPSPKPTPSGKYKFIGASPATLNMSITLDERTPDHVIEEYRAIDPNGWSRLFEQVTEIENQ